MMGGRGSAGSGAAKQYAAAYAKPKELVMPKLIGSEKQKKWANDIIRDPYMTLSGNSDAALKTARRYGEPQGGIVAVSSVGTQKNAESKRLFLRGYDEMMKRLNPKFIIFYGQVPEECDWNVIRVRPHYCDIVERRKNA